MAEKILIGANPAQPLYTFENPQILSCNTWLSSSLSGDELVIDQFMPVVYSGSYIRVCFQPKGSAGLLTSDGRRVMVYPGTGFLDKLPYGTPIWYYSNGVLVGKFYSQRIVRTSKLAFDILAVSAIGILDAKKHLGGVYTGESFESVAADIIGGTYPFTCSADVADIAVFGWLPISTRRANLHQLLFATGVMLDKDASGDLYFRFADLTQKKDVPDSQIFLGGTIDFRSPATRAEVFEHTFIKTQAEQPVTLFDNTDGSGAADNSFIAFTTAPVYDLAATDELQIISSGVNWAIVSGTGTLTGRPYSHVTQIVSEEAKGNGEENVVSVTDATLVSLVNSQNVAQRVLSYYGSARKISADIVANGEKAGDLICFTDPYGEPATAFLGSMDINASSFLRASCELIADYNPTGQGNNYKNAVVLSGTGTWNVPDEIKQRENKTIKVSIGSGGNGGNPGSAGASGTGSWTTLGEPGEGGEGGLGGAGGRVYTVTIDVSNISSFAYSCGFGGESGQQGTDSTFGSYSSAKGAVTPAGFVNLFTGAVYGVSGISGLKGGKGSGRSGEGDPVTDGITTWYPGEKGADESLSDPRCSGEGGYGGGAAIGSNGGKGEDGSADYNQGEGYGEGGDGGRGATGANGKNATAPCSGGNGGHGGGGGGANGASSGKSGYHNPGNPGAGGSGGLGGRGGEGLIVVYY